MTEAQKYEIRTRLSESTDPELLRVKGETLAFLFEHMLKLAPEMVTVLLQRLPVEQRLEGLAAAQRLQGLDAAHAVLALPIEVLRGLSADYITTLPQDIQDEVKRRLAQP